MPLLTEEEKRRKLPWSIVSSSLICFYGQITFGASLFVLFLDSLGLSKGQIGLAKAILPFAGITAIFTAPWVSRFGYKRGYFVFYGGRVLVFSVMLLAPAETGIYPWQKQYIPDAVRGRYGAAVGIAGTLASIAASTIGGAAIGASAPPARYLLLIVVGSVVGLAGVSLGALIPGGEPARVPQGLGPALTGVRGAIRDERFLLFLAGSSAVTVSVLSLQAFLPLYLTDVVRLSPGTVVLLDNAYLFGSLGSSFLWGRAADRRGSGPVLVVSAAASCLVPLCLAFSPRLGVGADRRRPPDRSCGRSGPVRAALCSVHGGLHGRFGLRHCARRPRRRPSERRYRPGAANRAPYTTAFFPKILRVTYFPRNASSPACSFHRMGRSAPSPEAGTQAARSYPARHPP